jgi:uncharacterized protein (TIGR00730 family)
MIKSIWLCGAASPRVLPEALQQATEFGYWLAANKIRLVFGGGSIGIMGAVADAVVSRGGDYLGVGTFHLENQESLLQGIEVEHKYHTVLIRDMSVRKQVQMDAAEAYVIMMGGVGTLDELLDVLVLRAIRLETKPIIVLDRTGHMQSIITKMLQALIPLGVVSKDLSTEIIFCKEVEDLNFLLDK